MFGYAPVRLEDVCSYSSDKIASSTLKHSNYVSVENLLPNKAGKQNAENIPENARLTSYKQFDILIGNIRPYLKKIWLATNDGGTNGDVLVIRVKHQNILLPEYAYYVLSSDNFFDYDNGHAKGAKMPRGNKKDVMKYQFLLPSIEYQERVVSILKKFDTFVFDLRKGIPAEIEARKKQYEYYRNALLSFKKIDK